MGGQGYQIAVRYQVEIRWASDGRRVPVSIQMVTGRLSGFLWNPDGYLSAIRLQSDIGRTPEIVFLPPGLTETARLESTLQGEGSRGKGAALFVATSPAESLERPIQGHLMRSWIFMTEQGSGPNSDRAHVESGSACDGSGKNPTKAAAGFSSLGLPEEAHHSRHSFSRPWMS